MMKGKTARLKNDGYAMVTVIIVIAFISILATTLLYVSGMNFQMKSVDYRLKENFYESEEFLEAVKAKFVELASDAADQAYGEVMLEAVKLRDSDSMQARYNEIFFEYIRSHWESDIEPILIEHVCYAEPSYTADQRWDIKSDMGYMNVNGFRVHYTDARNYTSYIDTDFRITAPKINWPVNESKTTWDTADDSAYVPTPIDYSDCVSYINWVKR